MSTITTARMQQIADDLREKGAYTSANSIEAIAKERDVLLQQEQLWRAEWASISETARVLQERIEACKEIVLRAVTLLEANATYGMQEKFEDGSRTPNAILCETTAQQLRSLL